MKGEVSGWVIFLVFVVLLLAGYFIRDLPQAGAAKEYKITAPEDFGNGVYYFHCVGEAFARSLSEFIAKHAELEPVSMAGDGSGGHGYDIGYFVVFRPKSP